MSKPGVLAVAFVAVLAIGGCGDSGGTPPKDGPAAAEAAKAFTADEYQALLDDSDGAVSKALTSARAAGSRDGLQTRLELSASKLEKAAAELGARPAPAGEPDASAAVKALSAAFNSAAGKVASGGLCTGPAAVAQITRSAAARDLPKGLVPKRQPMPALRLKNGSVLSRKGAGGPGVLTISNGNRRDGVVKLRAGGKRMSIYVAAGKTARVTGIPDGTFEVFFASGVSWDGKRNTFTRSCEFTKFERKMKFVTTGGQYTQFTMTLNAVAGGNAPSKQISPDDFPRG